MDMNDVMYTRKKTSILIEYPRRIMDFTTLLVYNVQQIIF